ncbi:DUF1360 domain-containing protein [Luedemannella helvata]|uniref:DUF1360 domain-containing protein n=1 Tax=Luedemannella helvata TaxID=349315 RepID=A0ABP4W7I1_9ACTN
MTLDVPRQVARDIKARYAGTARRPLGGYLAVMAGYTAAVGAAAGVARLTGRRLPDRVSAGDVALLSAATFRISRLITKDTITSPLRAPFTRFQESAGEGEVNEQPRGHGAQHAAGELFACPFCASVWTVTGLTAGLVFAPRLTRWVAAAATATAASDFLQLAYARARHAANHPGDT